MRLIPRLFLLVICLPLAASGQSITPSIDSAATVGDTLVWKYILPGAKDSFSNFKVDKLKGFTYVDLLGISETTRSELRKSDGKEILLHSETEIAVLVAAKKAGSFYTGSASAVWADGKVIRAKPQWIKVFKSAKTK